MAVEERRHHPPYQPASESWHRPPDPPAGGHLGIIKLFYQKNLDNLFTGVILFMLTRKPGVKMKYKLYAI
jgi:hypothetical protein